MANDPSTSDKPAVPIPPEEHLDVVTPAEAGVQSHQPWIPGLQETGDPARRTSGGLASAGMTREHRPDSIQIFGCRIDRLTYATALERVRSFMASSRPHQIVTANPLMLMDARLDQELTEVINAADMVVPESSGIRWASQQLGTPLDVFLPGIDLFLGMCRMANEDGLSVFLLGAEPGVADKAAVSLRGNFPELHIAGTHHGYFASPQEEAAVVEIIRALCPDMLFVAMSVPKQEKWIRSHLDELNVPVVMGVGGSFDVISGRLRRAPLWMREFGLEWLFRTLQQPWRINRLLRLPLFVWKILRS